MNLVNLNFYVFELDVNTMQNQPKISSATAEKTAILLAEDFCEACAG